jgi:cob(I)alamin adenosyltransferase
MKIYTRTGDAGQTSLYGGRRVDKDDARVEAYGNVDETNACLGLARSQGLPDVIDRVVERLQAELFVVGAELACAPGNESRLRLPLLGEEHVTALEADIDRSEAVLAPLRSFVLPAGTPGAAALHLSRTVCRRAERSLIAVSRESAVRPVVLKYVNRLSDLLFVLARGANHHAAVPDVPWQPRMAQD